MYSSEYYILESAKGDGTPLGESRDGRAGVFVFSDAKAAQEFASIRQQANEWRSVQLNAEEMLDWIRQAMSTRQVSLVWTDPATLDEVPTETSAEVFAECVAKVCGK